MIGANPQLSLGGTYCKEGKIAALEGQCIGSTTNAVSDRLEAQDITNP